MTSPEKRIPSEDQSEAIRFASGPCQIIAGPGSGKTFVLVEHITYLIESLHISPSSILVLTFFRDLSFRFLPYPQTFIPKTH